MVGDSEVLASMVEIYLNPDRARRWAEILTSKKKLDRLDPHEFLDQARRSTNCQITIFPNWTDFNAATHAYENQASFGVGEFDSWKNCLWSGSVEAFTALCLNRRFNAWLVVPASGVSLISTRDRDLALLKPSK